LAVDAQIFDEITRTAKVPVLVDFWAEWCAPCRMAAPQLQSVARDQAGRALVLKVNTDQQEALASRFQVRGIPHFVVLKHGRVVRQQSGLVDANQMSRWLADAA
jgi:thioredoxin 2